MVISFIWLNIGKDEGGLDPSCLVYNLLACLLVSHPV